jgi:RNA polymerase sigma-70 factor (sigma-E family)
MEWIGSTAAKREFERFVAEASDPLLRTGYLMTGNGKDAEDVAQETLLRVARRWSRVRSMDHPVAYARRILINLVLRGADRSTRQQTELQPRERAVEMADASAAQALREIEDLAEFRWALARLPVRQRAVLVLRYWSDLPVAEVADILGCSEGTVTSTASRAAGRLAEILAQAKSPAPEPTTPHA